MSKQEALDKLYTVIEEDDLEFADNIRVAREDDADAMRDYDEQADGGCCGCYDEKFIASDGVVWWIGCNYGH